MDELLVLSHQLNVAYLALFIIHLIKQSAGEEALTLLIQPEAEAKDEFLLRPAAQAALTLGLDFLDAFRARGHHSTVVEVSCNDQACASRACMTVNEDLLSQFLVESAHVLHDHEDLLFARARQILPVPVERRDAKGLELLGIVAEADVVVNAVTAE